MITQHYNYQLAKRGKWICPNCGHKTFVCYVDANGNVLNENVGKCDRADKCAYHYPPRDYFADNGIVSDVKQHRPIYKPQPSPVYITPALLKQSVTATMAECNNLMDYFKGAFGEDMTRQLVGEYYVGTSNHWHGATVFFQIDRRGAVHRGKVMQYNPINGKRVKEPFAMVTTVHKLMNLGDNLPPQCLFGEHLLNKYPDKLVAIVESEKTAMIASTEIWDCVFLACGGCGNLTPAMCEPLRGRDVILFPDNGQLDKWREKGRSLRHIFKTLQIADIMEREAINEGDDIGDLIVAPDFDITKIDLGLHEL